MATQRLDLGPRRVPPPKVLVRRAIPSDADDIALVLARAFAAYRDRYTAAAFEATVGTPARARARLTDGQSWVAVGSGRVLGTVSAQRSPERLYICSMAVDPAARGSGIGRRLLEVVERFAWQVRAERMWLSTTPFLTEAIRLYERYGFERREEGPAELCGTPLFTMERAVQAPDDEEDDA